MKPFATSSRKVTANPTPHADAREAPRVKLKSQPRAGGRERYMAQFMAVQSVSVLFVLALLPSIGTAQTFDNLQILVDQCALVTAGTWGKDLVARGERQDKKCTVTLPIAEFTKRYSHCALGGVWVGKERVHCEFGYQDRERTRVFFESGPDQLCTFICVRK